MKSRKFIIIYVAIAFLGVIVAFYFRFKTGKELNFFSGVALVFDWISHTALAIISLKIINIFYTRKSIGIYLSSLLFVPSIISIIAWAMDYGYTTQILYTAGNAIMCAVLIFITIKISSKRADEIHLPKARFSNDDDINAIEEYLGKGNTSLDVVIRSLVNRATAAQRMSTISLIFMLFILVVGGGASIGTTALDELKKVREIEVERNKLLSLNEKLTEMIELYDQRDSSIYTVVNSLQEKYGKEKSYEVVLQKIGQRSQNMSAGWQDLAMRISIAVLSLFLVQVFFHIYKFNQQQYSYLLAKSETLQLFKNIPDDDQKIMRDAMLSKMDTSPKFGKTPQSAIEIALELVNKAKGS